jgi:hypothetical protein
VPEFKLYIIADACAPAALMFGPFNSPEAADAWLEELKGRLPANEWHHKVQTIKGSYLPNALVYRRFQNIATKQWFTVHLVEVDKDAAVASTFEAAQDLATVLLHLNLKSAT